MSESTANFSLGPSSAGGPVTCAACGCRLEGVGKTGSQAWFHFSGSGQRDARGCRIDCAELAHDQRGRASAAIAS